MASEAEIKKMKLVQLKKECEKQGVSKTGRKADLVKRLIENLKKNATAAKAKAIPAQVPKKKAEEPPKEKEEVASSNQAEETAPAKTSPQTDEDKMAARKARFGITSAEDKKKARQARFGTAKNTEISKEKLAARAKRFGIPASADPSTLVTDDLKRKRMERFGTVDPAERMAKRQKRFSTGKEKGDTLPPLPKTDKEKEEAKKKMEARKDRFKTGTTTDKMKARQARFATS